MKNKALKVLSLIAIGTILTNVCSCGAKKEEKVTSETTTVASETTTAPETTEKTTITEALPPAEYPCEYSEEELHCIYEDNDIFGTLYTPDNGRDKHPVVILSHGYNCIGDDMADMAKKLAKNGVMSYTFDYCGGSTRSKSSGNSVDMSIETEQENLRKVIDMITELATADTGNIYLYGESQGGFVAGLTGAEMPDRIAGMFLIYPAFCIVDQWLAMDPSTMTEPFNFMGGMTLSKTFYDGVPRYDVYEHIKAFTNPVLIYQGDKDQVVNISYAKKIDEAFPDSVLTIVEGGGHGFSGKQRKLVLEGVTEFFEERGLNQ